MSCQARSASQWVGYILHKAEKTETGCLLFRKCIRIDGKEISTSRFIYEHKVGIIPQGKVVGKACKTNLCCNPDHLCLKNPGNVNNLDASNMLFDEDMVKRITELRSQQKTVGEISSILKISKSSAAKYVKGMHLSDETRKLLRTSLDKKRIHTIKQNLQKKWESQNKFRSIIDLKNYSKSMKGSIAESAIIYRLLLHDFSVYSSIFDGHKLDMVACNNKTGDLLKIQVKCTRVPCGFTPILTSKCMTGHSTFTPYKKRDLDILVGYDILNDSAYVFKYDEIKSREVFNVTVESRENWEKLLTC